MTPLPHPCFPSAARCTYISPWLFPPGAKSSGGNNCPGSAFSGFFFGCPYSFPGILARITVCPGRFCPGPFCPGVIFARVNFLPGSILPGCNFCPGKFCPPGQNVPGYPEFNGPLSGGTSLKNNFSQGARGWVLALRAKTQPRDA